MFSKHLILYQLSALITMAAAYSDPTITQAPTLVHAALRARQTTDATSELISQAIVFGNSILSELLSSTASSTSTSSSSTSTTSSSSSTASSTSSPSTSPSSTAASASSPVSSPSTSATSNSTHHSNTGLIIGLAVGLGVLGALLLLGLLWFCLRHRRKNKRAAVEQSDGGDSWIAPTEDNRSHLGEEDVFSRNHDARTPMLPPPVMTERAHPRLDGHSYDQLSPVSTNTHNYSPVNPFVAPHERPRPGFTEGISEPSSWDSSNPSRTAVSDRPRSPVEMFADVPLDHKDDYNRSSTSIWPSRKEASNFNFELGSDKDLAEPGIPQPKRGDEFAIPRRPVSGQPSAI